MSINNTTQIPETHPTPSPGAKRPAATKPMMVLFSVLGGITVLVLAAFTIFSSTLSFTRGSETITTDASGVTSLEVEAAASHFSLEFGDVTEATLETSGVRADGWELQREGNELAVEAPHRWFSWCLIDCNPDENHVTLTLPEQLNDGSLDTELDLAAGRLNANGNFERLAVDVGAGEATVNGSARQLDAQVNAGSANLSLEDVAQANLDIAAGRLNTELTGTAPESIEVEANAGRLDLTVPDVPYTVSSNVAAGDLDNQLQTSPNANHTIDVELNAGDATLRAGATPTN